jgi:hypothetical protein
MTYCIKNVLFDNLDQTNHVYNMGGPGTYETKASIRVNKNYIQGGTLVIQVDRNVDVKDMLPVAPVCTNQPINMCTVPPTIPTGCYDYDDAHTVHINVGTTDATGTVAADGEVTISNIPSPIYDNPSVQILGSGENFNWAAWHGWWVRGNSTGIKFTFNGINTAKIHGSHILVNFNLGVTNHMNGEEGLDGLVDVTINPGDPDPSMTYCIMNILFDNLDYLNHVYNMGGAGTYETRQSILVNKNYIQGGTLVIQVDRRTDNKDNLPAAPVCTLQPINMCTSPPTVPAGCYDYDDARTVHINVGTTDGTGTVAADGEVTISDMPQYEKETCFQFTQLLSQDEWFYQEPNEPNGTVYWLSIAAIYDPIEYIEYPWGWKTRRPEWNDDAVRIWRLLPTGLPMLGSKWVSGNPIEFPEDVSWDVAFELTTNRPAYADNPILGDLNGDKIVNFFDVAILADNWLKSAP